MIYYIMILLLYYIVSYGILILVRFFLFAVAWSSGIELELVDSIPTMPCQDELDEDASTARSGISLVHDIIDRGGFPTWISLVENAVQGNVKQ